MEVRKLNGFDGLRDAPGDMQIALRCIACAQEINSEIINFDLVEKYEMGEPLIFEFKCPHCGKQFIIKVDVSYY